jgi:hypothetical protein
MMCQNVLFYFIVQLKDALKKFYVYTLTVRVVNAVGGIGRCSYKSFSALRTHP